MQTDDIKKIIKDLGLDFDKVTINKDNSIDYNGDIDISFKGLDKMPIKFNIVKGDFDCSNNKLTDLNGVPIECNNFDCYNNKLRSLEYAPKKCNHFGFYIEEIKEVTFKEPAYVLKLLKYEKPELFK